MDRQNKKTLSSVLRHRVDIQTATRSSDSEGGVSTSWATVTAGVPASVDPIQARQQFQNRSVNVDATHIIKMRADVSLVETQQILWGSRVFEILTVENITEISEMYYITTKERR